MKAFVINQFGDSTVFETQQIEKPALKSGYMLIKVYASSINPVDLKIRSGLIPSITSTFPAILHGDVSGIVIEISPEITGFKVGDEVFGCAGGVIGEGGALAEYIPVANQF